MSKFHASRNTETCKWILHDGENVISKLQEVSSFCPISQVPISRTDTCEIAMDALTCNSNRSSKHTSPRRKEHGLDCYAYSRTFI